MSTRGDKILYRGVSLKEISSCPNLRLDPKHYLPEHKRDQCERPKDKLVRCMELAMLVIP